MSDDFLTAEASIELSAPREIYEIVQSAAVTYYIASGTRDIDYAGHTYVASPIARTDVGVSSTSGDFELSLSLPLSHGLCQRYLAQGSPPRQVSVTIYRSQPGVSTERIWSGIVTSMAWNLKDNIASFRIPTRLGRAVARKISAITCGVACPHILYGADCQADPTSFSQSTTVVTVNGRVLTVASIGTFFGDGGDGFYLDGDITHVATGENMMIIGNGPTPFTQLTMQAPIPDMKTGDAVVIRAGCKHDVGDCFTKFSNMVHYGGQPQLPSVDIFISGNKWGIFSFGVPT